MSYSVPEQKIVVHAHSKSILRTVLEKCKEERDDNQLRVSLKDYAERASYYTGHPKKYMLQLESEDTNKMPGAFSSIRSRITLLKCLKAFYIKGKLFSDFNLYQEISKVMKLPGFDEFQLELSALNYRDRKTVPTDSIIMEDPKITFERFHYIKKIKKMRDQQKSIYYIEERVIDTTLKFDKTWTNGESTAGKLIYFHITSREGYENGLFSFQNTTVDLIKWVLHILLPILRPSSVIVLDNNPLHGTTNKDISHYHSKQQMLGWLRDNNIPCHANMHKAELYDLIEKCSVTKEEQNIDRIFKAHGHEVLRLPSNLFELSINDLLWTDITSLLIAEKSFIFNINNIKEKVNILIQSLPSEKWIEYETDIENIENEIFSIDTEIEDCLENNYKMDLND